MSKSWGETIYGEGDTVERATLRLAAKGAIEGVTYSGRVPPPHPVQRDHTLVLKSIDTALAEWNPKEYS